MLAYAGDICQLSIEKIVRMDRLENKVFPEDENNIRRPLLVRGHQAARRFVLICLSQIFSIT